MSRINIIRTFNGKWHAEVFDNICWRSLGEFNNYQEARLAVRRALMLDNN